MNSSVKKQKPIKDYKTEMLYQYMKKRSKVENQKWGLSRDDLEGWFNNGIRTFFGVWLSDDGFIMGDNQSPKLPNGRNFIIETVSEILEVK